MKNDLIQKAVRYARIRTDYQLAPSESMNEIGGIKGTPYLIIDSMLKKG